MHLCGGQSTDRTDISVGPQLDGGQRQALGPEIIVMVKTDICYLCIFIQEDRLDVVLWDQFNDPAAHCGEKESVNLGQIQCK